MVEEWLENTLKALMANVCIQWHYDAHKKEDGSNCDVTDKEFHNKLKKIQIFSQQFSSTCSRKRLPWRVVPKMTVCEHCTSGTFAWLESSMKVVFLIGFKVEGTYKAVSKM